MKKLFLDKQSFITFAKEKGRTILKDNFHKGNVSIYAGRYKVGEWSVNKGEGYIYFRD